jgi:CubicO group peptidase (beta-lactamase class C family)
MLSNQLGPDVQNQLRNSGSIHADYGFGLAVAVRVTPGIASTTGSIGDFSWPGAFGTYWWGDPRGELAVVWMTQTPGSARGSARGKYQRMIRAMVNEAITDWGPVPSLSGGGFGIAGIDPGGAVLILELPRRANRERTGRIGERIDINIGLGHARADSDGFHA